MREKLSTKYHFTVKQVKDDVAAGRSAGIEINLVELETGKVKVFFIAGNKNPDRVLQHMNSLTDDLCSSWFSQRERKKK